MTKKKAVKLAALEDFGMNAWEIMEVAKQWLARRQSKPKKKTGRVR